jgi:HSP20 family molecular chaperone IbpA
MQFQESKMLEGEVAGEVWKRASAIRDIPKYWHGTRSLDIVRNDGGPVRVKVKFAFGGSGEADVSIDEEKRSLTIEYRSGPFTGEQVISVDNSSIKATWDVKFRSVFRLASKWNEGHFRSGTVHALERLVSGGKEEELDRLRHHDGKGVGSWG